MAGFRDLKRKLSRRRFTQREVFPTTVKSRLLGKIVGVSALGSSTGTVGNGDQVVFSITTSTSSGSLLISIPDVTLYVGSIASANQLPGGSSIDESQWQVIFMGNDWNDTDGNNTVYQIYVRNISAGASKDVILRTVSRAITNKPV